MKTLYESILDTDNEIKDKIRLESNVFNTNVRTIFRNVFGSFCDVNNHTYNMENKTLCFKLKRPIKEYMKTYKQLIVLTTKFYNELKKIYKLSKLSNYKLSDYSKDEKDEQPFISFAFLERPDDWYGDIVINITILEDGYVGIDNSDIGIEELFVYVF